jgi:hypothetical protein
LGVLSDLVFIQRIARDINETLNMGDPNDNFHQAVNGVLDSTDSVLEGIAEIVVIEFNMGFKDLFESQNQVPPPEFV